MKFLTAAASAAALAALTPAMALAQDAPNTGVYANLGYAHADAGAANYEVIQGKLGYRFNPYLGVEAEGAFGLSGDNVNVAGTNVHTKLSHEFAGYGVAYLPLRPNTDLFARVGYGTTKIHASAAGVGLSGSEESWNFGAGAQHYFDGVNGVRVEYTRQEFNHGNGHDNVWGVAYTRRF
jgi:hypothetical protein